MLTKQDVFKLITLVHADGGFELRKEKVDIWFDALQHLDKNLAFEVGQYLRTMKTFGEPKLQDFINALEKCTKPKELDISADQAFNAVIDGIRKYSYHHDDKLLADLPAVVAQAAKTFGIKEIRMSENISYTRMHFARCFESIKSQHEKHHLEKLALPPQVHKQIEDRRSENREKVLELINSVSTSLPEVA